MNEFFCYHDKKKNGLILIVISLLFSILLYGSYYFYSNDQSIPIGFIPIYLNNTLRTLFISGKISLFYVCISGAVLLGITNLLLLKRLLNKKPILMINDVGITTKAYPLIPWNAISEIKIVNINSQSIIGIVLKHPEKYKRSSFKSLLDDMNFRLTGTHILLDVHLTTPQQEIFEKLKIIHILNK